jgi:ribosomal protein S18 acetylase RimI-like enzyme
MKIQIANQSHLDELLKVAYQTFVDTYGHLNTPDNLQQYVAENFTKEALWHEMQEEGAYFLVGILDGIIVAYAKLRTNEVEFPNRNALEIQRIYLQKTLHGLRLGSKMMQACIDLAKQKGYAEICLGVWEENPKAIQFYKKWGFEIFDSHPFVIGEEVQNDYLMRKVL